MPPPEGDYSSLALCQYVAGSGQWENVLALPVSLPVGPGSNETAGTQVGLQLDLEI